MEKQANGGANRWIATAAEEIRQIEKRWGFTSIRQFSKFLQMNPRTLSKLPHHDGTLTLESIAKAHTITEFEICGQRGKGRGATLKRLPITHHDECSHRPSNPERRCSG